MAVEYIANALGTDLSIIDAELQKIILFAGESKEITLEQARLMVVPQREIASFEIRESFGNRDARGLERRRAHLPDRQVVGRVRSQDFDQVAMRSAARALASSSVAGATERAVRANIRRWPNCRPA